MVGVAVPVDRGRQTVGVFLLGQFVERRGQVGRVGVWRVDLVVQSPYINRGMVVALAN